MLSQFDPHYDKFIEKCTARLQTKIKRKSLKSHLLVWNLQKNDDLEAS